MANESMIAACPRCAARYRLERGRLRSEGVRLRCTRCEAVFRVTPPASVSAPGEAHEPQPAAKVPTPEASVPAPSEMASASPELAPPPSEVAVPPSPEVAVPPSPEVAVPPSPDVAVPPSPDVAVPPSPDVAVPPSPEVAVPPSPDVAVPPSEMSAPSLSSEAAVGSPEPEKVAQSPAASALAPAPAAVVGGPASSPDAPGQPRSEAERRNLVLLADSEVDAGKGLASTLASWGLEPLLVHDGVEAILTIQRALPRLVILDAALPKMFGFQVCELIKRNESLRSIKVVLLGAIHHRGRYRRAPTEIYGADAYAERPELPEALRPILSRFGFPVEAAAPPPASLPMVEPPRPAPEVAPLPEPMLEPEPAPQPMLELDPAPEPMLELDPTPEPMLELDPAPEPLLEVERLSEAIEPGASDLAAPETGPGSEALAPGSEALAPPPLEPLHTGMDQDFEVLDVEDDSFDAQTPLESLEGDSLVEPTPFAPESLAEADPLTLQPPVAGDAQALEPPTAELPLEAPASEPPTAELPLEAPAPEPADPAVSAAERLARIIVSDVVLYNPEKFEEGVRAGNVVELLDTELEEGRGLFEQRVAPELRTGRDFLAEELVRVARSRGMRA